MTHHNEQEKPVRDDGLEAREVPYRAGGGQGTAGTRKRALLSAGPGTGFVPGHDEGTGPRSSARAGYVHEDMKSGYIQGNRGAEYARRPMPRHQPMEEEMTRAGRRVRFLDGHSEYMRDRPGLLAELHDPETPEEDKDDLRSHIVDRDVYHGHIYW